jgi:putative transposase
MDVFTAKGDYALYLDLLREWCERAGTKVWAYCLMPNHVHLILVPSHEDGLRAALGEVHRRYARHVNRREDWRGHLWQERFHSFVMDKQHALACARYVELSPVRARLVKRPEGWAWSSARAHLDGADDDVVTVRPLLAEMPDWRTFLAGGVDEAMLEILRGRARTGHPLGSERFYKSLERKLGRSVKPARRGRPPATADDRA